MLPKQDCFARGRGGHHGTRVGDTPISDWDVAVDSRPNCLSKVPVGAAEMVMR